MSDCSRHAREQLIEHHVVRCDRGLFVHTVAENGPEHSSHGKCDFISPPTVGEQIVNLIRGCVRTDGLSPIHEFASITYLRSCVLYCVFKVFFLPCKEHIHRVSFPVSLKSKNISISTCSPTRGHHGKLQLDFKMRRNSFSKC